MPTAYIALGSNLGDREAHLAAAVAALAANPANRGVERSAWHETAPLGGPIEQGAYLNGVVRMDTTLEPCPLLDLLLNLETKAGRVRTEANGPRPLDLDLLLYDQRVIAEPGLIVPHPRLHERLFVLLPLAELGSNVVHPLLKQPIARLLADRLRHPLAGLRALVTGSSTGIGKAIAFALGQRGAAVIVHAHTSAKEADGVANEVFRHSGRAEVLLADLRDPAACARLADEAWERFGGLDLFVANAGADILTGAGKQADFLAKLEQLWLVDVRSTLLLARDLGGRMKQAGRGTILTLGWDQAETGMEGDSGELFAAAKGVVMAATKSLAKSLAPQVRVNCLAPGWIKTAWGETAPTAWQERAKREALLGRWGRPDEIAAAACWLASADADFITGQTIRINGGAVT